MSVPISISQLSVVPANNSPVGSEPVGNNLSTYLQTAFAFIAQVANGSGLTQGTALNMNSHQINNVSNGTAATDAINLGQLKAYLPVGTLMDWYGTATNAAVQAAWGAGWAICDGTNGTPDFRNRGAIGAGASYAVGAAGGTNSYVLSVANLPPHAHGVNDPTHAHSVADPGHNHYVNDPGHSHAYMLSRAFDSSGGTGSPRIGRGQENSVAGPFQTSDGIYPSGTGIWLNASGTGIGIYGAATGISIQNTGSGAALNIVPPFVAVTKIMKISNA